MNSRLLCGGCCIIVGIIFLVVGVSVGVTVLNSFEGVFIGANMYIHDDAWDDPAYEVCANESSGNIYFHNITNPVEFLSGAQVAF
jgi:hypothetical protein